MTRPTKQDPYCEFKDDQERRRALNTRVRTYSAAVIVMTMVGAPVDWMEKLRWAMHFLR